MNYYQDYSKMECPMNRYNDRYNNDYNYNHCDKDFNTKHSCCIRRVEENFCCFPSYYTEENKDDKKERCFEGTFKICPKYNTCEDKEDKQEEKHYKDNYGCNNRCFGLCRLFRRW